jgi:predicted nucleic acid-binding protein
MTSSVYIESSVVSYITARPSRDIVTASRQAITVDWWQNNKSQFEIFISPLVLEKIGGGDLNAANQRLRAVSNIPSVSISTEAESVAKQLLISKAVPANSERDALHIAIAATQGIDYLLTWNFKHINNAITRILVTSVVKNCGYECPILCSPEELGG